jgi:AcrR family transcriptional regulator
MDKREKKKALILDAMRKLISEGRAADCSVSEIAKAADIGKGSVYYYYDSKREIEMDLFYRTYGNFIKNCEGIIETQANALEKLKNLFATYYSQSVDIAMDNYLHLPQNMDMHQKVLALLVNLVSPIFSKILEQGISEGVFKCDKPDGYAQIFICVLAFMFDIGIFELTEEDSFNKLLAFAELMERGLGLEKGTLSFMHDREYLRSLPLAEECRRPFLLANA